MPNLINKRKIFFYLFIVLSCAVVFLTAHPALGIEIEIKGLNTSAASSDPAQYIQFFFTFGLGLVGFLAVAAIVIGGIMYMTGSTVGKVDRAKSIIAGAITGLVLLLCSYLLLSIIDPTLVKLSPSMPAMAPVLQGAPATTQQTSTPGGGTISGTGTQSCSITNCGSQQVQGKTLSIGAAANYLSLQQQIQQACTVQGLSCTTLLTFTTSGTHRSTCHTASSPQNGGTCADFEIMAPACGGSIRYCTDSQRAQYMQIASQVMTGSNLVVSCANEYIAPASEFSTGNHYHCNF